MRRHRWPVEVYHEAGKAAPKGNPLDQYQGRDFTAIQRHIALAAVVYCLRRTAQHDQALHHKLHCELKFELETALHFGGELLKHKVSGHLLCSSAPV